ncbi:MAG TPA: cell envelope integrity protein TolA, partial [Methylophilaceae bacterium]|nr:cell envelope integrity protein TolA [Methylophilaceae bacterium]
EEELKRKQEAKLKEEQKRKEDEKRKQEEKRKEEQQRKLADLQKMIADENQAAQQERQAAAQATAQSAAASAASAREVDKYISLISSKIRRNVNKQLCGEGKPELTFGIALMPTGEVIGNPKIVKSSGIAACDQAVERAILQAQPLPLPSQPDLFAQFRDLQLKFRPNDEN